MLFGALVLTGCTSDGEADQGPDGALTPVVASTAPITGGTTSEGTRDERDGNAPAAETHDADDPAYDVALRTPVEDSIYPGVGDPGVDALHYYLDLTWDPDTSLLTGVEQFQVDLDEALVPTSVTLDGDAAEFEHRGKDLVVDEPVEQDGRYVLVVEYAGTPRPAAAPTTRSDVSTTGWTITEEGETWTMSRTAPTRGMP